MDEYLKSLIHTKESLPRFKLFYEENEFDDERTVTNSYIFSKILIERILVSDIDFDFILHDLETKLGNEHPVIAFLKQFKDQ